MKMIGLCGYAQAGKDTAAENMPRWHRFAFADALKRDVKFIMDRLGVNLDIPEHKRIIRPLLVEYGKAAREFQHDYWIDRLKSDMMMTGMPEQIVITDVRYINEVLWIKSMGGQVIYIARPCQVHKCPCRGELKPASEEEQVSIEIIHKSIKLPRVLNDNTPSEMVKRILAAYTKATGEEVEP